MDRLKHQMTKIRRIVADDLPLLEKMAKADDHSVVLPTHVVERDRRIIGYISLGAIPTVIIWLNSGVANVRDSLATMTFFENTIADRGCSHVIVPCNDKSPYRGYIEQAGYLDMQVGMFVKQL